LLPGSVADRWVAPKRADVLMTSPPYGDNKTTVPYGQHSYLPLCWIDTDDIPGGFDRSLLESTLKIDSASLGGSIRNAGDAREELVSVSAALERFLPLIDDAPPLRKKVLSFVRDYRDAMHAIRPRLRDGAFCFFTLGERRVGRQVFPLVDITKELLRADGHENVTTIERVLPGSRKRMAAKNNQGDTMAQEWIVVTRSWAVAPVGGV
jgi:site-specific DNA-methyltransferase (cytosine-N4-specific)